MKPVLWRHVSMGLPMHTESLLQHGDPLYNVLVFSWFRRIVACVFFWRTVFYILPSFISFQILSTFLCRKSRSGSCFRCCSCNGTSRHWEQDV
jgi:hypothetical protein